MRWGQWTLDGERLCLVNKKEEYEVDLEGIQSSAAIVDWIFQILEKPWADASVLLNLLGALNDILEPQANYCAWEQDLRPDVSQVIRRFMDRHQTFKEMQT